MTISKELLGELLKGCEPPEFARRFKPGGYAAIMAGTPSQTVSETRPAKPDRAAITEVSALSGFATDGAFGDIPALQNR